MEDDFQLPKGWRVEQRTRKSGKSAGAVDTYYHAPDGGRYRSKKEAKRAIEAAAKTVFAHERVQRTSPKRIISPFFSNMESKPTLPKSREPRSSQGSPAVPEVMAAPSVWQEEENSDCKPTSTNRALKRKATEDEPQHSNISCVNALPKAQHLTPVQPPANEDTTVSSTMASGLGNSRLLAALNSSSVQPAKRPVCMFFRHFPTISEYSLPRHQLGTEYVPSRSPSNDECSTEMATLAPATKKPPMPSDKQIPITKTVHQAPPISTNPPNRIPTTAQDS
eukprot:1567563-Pyramimonas_sp.AAC.1